MKEKTRKSILLAIVCILTLMIVFLALKINDNRKKDLLSISQIDDYLTEIKYEEIENHVVEQPSTIIYVINSSEYESKKFDKRFIPIVKKYDLANNVIYLNLNNTTIVDPVYQKAPQLVFYVDGNISDIINCNTLKNEKQIIQVLTERGYIND